MIDGVLIKPLHFIPDERGRLMEIFRRDDPFFSRFGQVYVTTTYPGIVKAWHCHRRQDDHVCCIRGMIRLALFDDRPDSSTCGHVQEFFIGESAPKLVRIPYGVWHGWKAVGLDEAFVINCPTEPYLHDEPDELRRPWNDQDIPFDWGVHMG